MKLTQQQADHIQEKTGLEPVPNEIAAQSGLTQHFGDDTFYLNADGIFVFEDQTSAEDQSTVTAVKIAAVEQVGEGSEVVVRGVEPQQTTLTVDLA